MKINTKTVKAIIAGAMLACGVASESLAGDRINLWPLVYDDGDGTYVAWPLMRFSDSGKSWIFPIFWDDDEFYVWPEVWVNREVVAVLPFMFDPDGKWFSVFPLWWNSWRSGTMSCLFPAYYFDKNQYHTHFWSMAGLAGYWRDGKNGEGTPTHWILPLYAKNRDGFFSLPYSHTSDGDFFFCGLGGLTRGDDAASWLFPLYYGDKDETVTPLFGWGKDYSWVLPLYYSDETDFLSLPFMRHREGNTIEDRYLLGLAGRISGENEHCSWLFPLYFSGDDLFVTPLFGWTSEYSWCFPLYYRDGHGFYSIPYTHTDAYDLYLLGLAGRTFGAAGDSSWLFPLFYSGEDGWATPLCGQSGDAAWCLPLFYHDDHDTFTLPYGCGRDGRGKRYMYSLPLLSYYEWKDDSDNHAWITLAGLLGGEKRGSHSKSWALPLYYRSETARHDKFYSLLFGWNAEGAQTNSWWLTPLVGTKSGKETGGWLFPLFSHAENPEYDRRIGWLDAKTLPEELNIRSCIETNRQYDVDANVYRTNVAERLRADNFYSKNDTTVMIVSGVDNSVSGSRSHSRRKDADGRERDVYNMRSRSESGNIFVLKNKSSRSVDFDMETRRRIDESESVESETSLFMFLFNREHRKSAKEDYTRSRVLWKLWDREEKDGNVTVDAFPGFTYDSKTNGYTKTSFLWRFFRYENDPGKDSTAVDLFFIPVWR